MDFTVKIQKFVIWPLVQKSESLKSSSKMQEKKMIDDRWFTFSDVVIKLYNIDD